MVCRTESWKGGGRANRLRLHVFDGRALRHMPSGSVSGGRHASSNFFGEVPVIRVPRSLRGCCGAASRRSGHFVGGWAIATQNRAAVVHRQVSEMMSRSNTRVECNVTPTTSCPTVRGGRVLHYPRFVAGRPVTMPYLDARVTGLPRVVFLSLCGSALLVPPRCTGDGERTSPLCANCAELSRGEPVVS
jgi:hypothetical protein